MLYPSNLSIAGKVGVLETLFVPSAQTPRGIAVICHPNPLQGGNNSHKIVKTAAKALSNQGYACYCPNFRGVANSAGEHDYGRGEIDDVLAVVEFARAEHIGLPLVLAGFSFGAFVAARAHQLAGTNKLLLIGTAVGKYPLPTPNVPADTLIIHGELDEIIPLADLLNWARPQGLPITLFPDAGHFFHGKLASLGRIIERWFMA